MPFNSSSIWYETSSAPMVVSSGSSSLSSEGNTYSDTLSTFDLVTPSSTAFPGYSTSTPFTSSSSSGSSTSLSALDQSLTTLDLKTSTSASLTYTSSIEGSSQDSSLSNFITAASSSIKFTSSPSSSTPIGSETSYSQVSTPLIAPYYSSSFSNSTLITSHHTSSPSSQRSWSSSTSTAVLFSSSSSEQYSSSSSSDSGFSVSQNAQSVYYIYTQMYQITGSTTTFNTGILSTVELAKSASTSFSVPQTTSTKDIQFYQNWLNGNLGDSGAQSPNATKNKIIGGVVGGVGGLIICSLIIWLMFSRRRKNKDEQVNTSFSSEIGRRAGYPLPSPSPDANEEKIITQDNGTGAIFSKIKNKAKAFPQMSRNVEDSREDNHDDNPFQNEFNFEARIPPPVPPPRKATMQYPIPGGEATSQTDGRYSYVSSMSDSSYVSSAGDHSTMSSTSIRLGSEYNNNNNVPGSSQGFLREVI